jgi:hypothetical protein
MGIYTLSGKSECGCPTDTSKPNAFTDVGDIDEFIRYVFDDEFGPNTPTHLPKVLQDVADDFTMLLALNAGINCHTNVELEESQASNTKRVKLGTHDMPNQSRLHKHSNTDWRTETRPAWKQAYADLTHARISDFVRDAVECTKIAATTAVLTAIFAENPGAGLAIFKPTFLRTCFENQFCRFASRFDMSPIIAM